MDEQQAIDLAIRGDTAAFNELVRMHQASAHAVALRMLRDPESAADATQDAFISAYRHIAELRGPFKPWLLRIVVNRCYDTLRQNKRTAALSLDATGPDGQEPAAARTPSREESPFEYAARRELGQVIEKGLATLSAEMRLTLILIDIEGGTYEETAEIMGTNLGTVKSRLARARAQMRDYLMRKEATHHAPDKTRATLPSIQFVL